MFVKNKKYLASSLCLLTGTSALVTSAECPSSHDKSSELVNSANMSNNCNNSQKNAQKNFFSKFFSFFVRYTPDLLAKKMELNKIAHNIRKKEKKLKEYGDRYFSFNMLKSELDYVIQEIVKNTNKKMVLKKDLNASEQYLNLLKDVVKKTSTGNIELRKLDTRFGAKTFSKEFSKGEKIYVFVLEQKKLENFEKKLQKDEKNARNAFEEMINLIYEKKELKNTDFTEKNFEEIEKTSWFEKLEKRLKDKNLLNEYRKKINDDRGVINKFFRDKEKLKEMQKDLEQFKKSSEYAALEVEKVDDLIFNTLKDVKNVIETVERYLGEDSYTKVIRQNIDKVNGAKKLEDRLVFFVTLKDLFSGLLEAAPSIVKSFNEKKGKLLKMQEQLFVDMEYFKWQIRINDEKLQKLNEQKNGIFLEMLNEKYKAIREDFHDLEILKSQRDIINRDFLKL